MLKLNGVFSLFLLGLTITKTGSSGRHFLSFKYEVTRRFLEVRSLNIYTAIPSSTA